MKKKYHTAGTGLKYNRNIVKRGKIDTSNTQIQVMAAHFPCLVDIHVQVVLLNLSNSFMVPKFALPRNIPIVPRRTIQFSPTREITYETVAKNCAAGK